MQVPMTPLEELLRERFLIRYPKGKPFLTEEEMHAYIDWLVTTRTGSENVQLSDPTLEASMRQVNAGGKAALDILYMSQREHREGRFLVADYDISVGRMFRYMPAHWHANDFFEIYYCAGGTCPIHFKKETVPLHKGDVLIIAPGESHASPCYADDAILYFYMVRSSTFDKVFWNQLPKDSLMAGFFRRALGEHMHAAYLQFETGSDPEVERILKRIDTEHAESEPYSPQMMNVLLSAFFLLVLRRYEGTARLPRTEDFYWSHRFSAVFSYLQIHYADRSLSDIAAEFHYSERQINRIVENATGNSFQHLVLRLKMERAAELLSNHRLSIESIADGLGYAGVPSFLRAFKAYHGMTPARYRKARIQELPSTAEKPE